jgi:hypothetical protein
MFVYVAGEVKAKEKVKGGEFYKLNDPKLNDSFRPPLVLTVPKVEGNDELRRREASSSGREKRIRNDGERKKRKRKEVT